MVPFQSTWSHTSFHPPKMLRLKLAKKPLNFPLRFSHRNIPSFEKWQQILLRKPWASRFGEAHGSWTTCPAQRQCNLLRTVWEGKVIISVEKEHQVNFCWLQFVGIAFPLITAEVRQYDRLVLQFWQSSRSCWLKCWISTISCWAFWYLSDLCIFIPGIKQFFVLL